MKMTAQVLSDEDIVKLCESMDSLDVVHPPGQPADDPPELCDLYQAKTMLLTTRKPIHTHAYTEKHAEMLIAMNAAVMGGMDELRKKPHLIFSINTFSPLAIRKDSAEVIRTGERSNTGTIGCLSEASATGQLRKNFGGYHSKQLMLTRIKNQRGATMDIVKGGRSIYGEAIGILVLETTYPADF
jgi:hypothetical protein